MKKRLISMMMITCLLFTGCQTMKQNKNPGSGEEKSEEYIKQMAEASSTPFGKYPEEITYTLGKLSGVNNSNMPAGDSYENNAYTRYLKEILNIQNDNIFEAEDTIYENMVTMAISNNEIPDIMIVNDLDTLKNLVKLNMIEDLTSVYESCTSETIKKIYNSYDGRALEQATFDDKLMALPGTNIAYGPNLVWLRKDWMDDLGLTDPTSMNDVVEIINQFVEMNPGKNRTKTIGLVCDSTITGNYDSQYQMDLIFATYGAFPQKWITGEDNTVVYGSVTKEAKEALGKLQELYKLGILDNQFLVRSNNNINELIVSGQCGSFFAPWWAPNNPLMESMQSNPEANWQPYLIPTNEDGSCSVYAQDPSNKYIVVRKGYEHPEIVMKIISVLFDYERFQDKDEEILASYSSNLDPSARPIVVNVDFNDAIFISNRNIKNALNESIQVDKLSTLDRSYYEACKAYLNSSNPTAEEWAAYMSRIKAIDLLADAKIQYVDNVYIGETNTMQTDWWKLKMLEKDAYLKIITGEQTLDYFDTFVTEWYQQGGKFITHEVNAIFDKSQ